MKEFAVFGVVNGIDGGSEDAATSLLQPARDVQWRLPAELHDYAFRLLALVYLEHVFDRHRLEIQFVGRIVVGGDRLGVAIDDDRLVAHFAHGHRRVAAAVVELYALAYPVRAAAEYHHLLAPVRRRDFVRPAVVARIVVFLAFDAGNGYRVPRLRAAYGLAPIADALFGYAEQLREIFVRKSILFRFHEQGVRYRERFAFRGRIVAVGQYLFLLLDKFAHLLDEPGLHAADLEYLLVGRALAQRLVHLEVALGIGRRKHLEQFVKALFVEILREAEA